MILKKTSSSKIPWSDSTFLKSSLVDFTGTVHGGVDLLEDVIERGPSHVVRAAVFPTFSVVRRSVALRVAAGPARRV